jgi:hypothetical protein
MNNKIILIIIGVLIFGGFLIWLFIASSKPVPGEKFADLGRDHVNDISDEEYNSNPPTSGKHFPVWAKRGVYNRVLSDGHLLHSLEHGYVVISYNCDIQTPSSSFLVPTTYAHEGEPVEIHDVATDSANQSFRPLMRMIVTGSTAMSFFTPDNPPPQEIELSEIFQSEDCQNLVNQLSDFLDSFQRLIIVPRPGMDARIALTAWTRLEKLDDFDKETIKTFIETYHNQGPEKTVE